MEERACGSGERARVARDAECYAKLPIANTYG